MKLQRKFKVSTWMTGALLSVLIAGCAEQPSGPSELSETVNPLLPFGPAMDISAADAVALATGSVLRGPFVPTGATGNGRGIAFDGTDLYYTIVGDPNIYRTDTFGALQSTIGIPAGDPRVSSGGPLAWDGTHLWTVDYGTSLIMYRVDPATGATASSCSVPAVNPGHPALAGLDSPDGLHWTGTQLVLSGEIALIGRPAAVAFMDPDCTITSFFTSPAGQNGAWSGVAYDGFNLYHGDPSQRLIEQTDLAGVKTGLFFGSAGLQLEDLEYDGVTFAPACAVWGNQATIGPNQIAAFEVPCPVIPVDIDIKPGSDPNSINCTAEQEVIAVAILTTDDFDATTVDHTTVTFEGAGETHVSKQTGEARRHEEDVDGDGDIDLVLHFRLGDTSLTCDSTEGTLLGLTFDGFAIEGTDAVRMIG